MNSSRSGYDLFVSVSSVTTSVDEQSLLNDSRDCPVSDPLLSSPSHSQKTTGCEPSGHSIESRHKLPVFQTEEDRVVFDRCLEVDIAPLVSGMYRCQNIVPFITDLPSRIGSVYLILAIILAFGFFFCLHRVCLFCCFCVWFYIVCLCRCRRGEIKFSIAWIF